ncbi:hypothetical protein HHK36_004111 [Tetracentron sinense]|uniref:Uncharacterized protein n=1 Tax=Tetracentron sinense TaxID=13715 RepID=A0A835DPY9_TETSI|nr:hypothetical protein HHK36_004111 [Tetracentron sinense]
MPPSKSIYFKLQSLDFDTKTETAWPIISNATSGGNQNVGDHFCSSSIYLKTLNSISEPQSQDSERITKRLRREIKGLQATTTAVEFEFFRNPVIARIHGACIGGGIDIVNTCDIRHCMEDVFFSV